jgi:hypothetical protein
VNEKFLVVPIQPAATGVTLKLLVSGFKLVSIAVKAAIFPEPLLAKPMELLLLVQLYTVPLTVLAKFTKVLLAALQMV